VYILIVRIGICTVAVLDTLENTERILKEFFLCHEPGSCGIVQHKEATRLTSFFLCIKSQLQLITSTNHDANQMVQYLNYFSSRELTNPKEQTYKEKPQPFICMPEYDFLVR
jgi:hypothetical protein